MRTPAIMLAFLLVASAAQAQSAAPASRSSDNWSAPAHAATAGYRAGGSSSLAGEAASPRFEFKQRQSRPLLPENAAQQHSGKAPIGVGAVDPNGRPAVSCPQTPMDPACH